jgi:hypothetical protein
MACLGWQDSNHILRKKYHPSSISAGAPEKHWAGFLEVTNQYSRLVTLINQTTHKRFFLYPGLVCHISNKIARCLFTQWAQVLKNWIPIESSHEHRSNFLVGLRLTFSKEMSASPTLYRIPRQEVALIVNPQ